MSRLRRKIKKKQSPTIATTTRAMTVKTPAALPAFEKKLAFEELFKAMAGVAAADEDEEY